MPKTKRIPIAYTARISSDYPNDSSGATFGFNGQLTLYMRPDMSQLPAGAYVVDAKLTLKFSSIDTTGAEGVIEVQSILDNWSSSTNYNTRKPLGPSSRRMIAWSVLTHTLDVTQIVSAMSLGSSYGISLTSLQPYFFTTIPTESYVDVTYREPASAPTVTYPNGGEVVDKTHIITWNPSTDPEGNRITYQVQLSLNRGQSWKTIGSNIVGTSFAYNFSNDAETSLALIRVRAFNTYSYGQYDTSNGVFTIEHNVAPSTPSSLKPNGTVFDRTKTNKFEWKHNDSPNDVQSRADIRWRIVGTTEWRNSVSNGPDTEYYFASLTIPNGQIEWQVRTYDAKGLVSPWSQIAVFTSAEPASAPTIISPTTTVNVPRPIVQWTSASQASYQIIVEDSLGLNVWDSGEIVSTVKARTVGVDLANGGTYRIKVRVKDGSGLFSSFNEVTVLVAYTPPAKPQLAAYKADAAIQLVITNPTPTGTQPIVLSSDIYKLIDDEWIRIATNVSSTYTDYAVASGEVYTYYAIANGATGTYTNSDRVSQSVTFKGAYIHDPLDAEFTVYKFAYNGTGAEDNFTPESVLHKYVGRRRPVAQFGTYGEYTVRVTLQAARDMTPMNRLSDFVENRMPICYRDDNGIFLYGVIQSLPKSKEYHVATADITITEVDYDVEV